MQPPAVSQCIFRHSRGSDLCETRVRAEWRPSVDATILSRHPAPASTPCAPTGLSELQCATTAVSFRIFRRSRGRYLCETTPRDVVHFCS
jgi:hypothetical protein